MLKVTHSQARVILWCLICGGTDSRTQRTPTRSTVLLRMPAAVVGGVLVCKRASNTYAGEIGVGIVG